MTIKFTGTVESIRRKGNAVQLTIKPLSGHVEDDIDVVASRGETDAYRVGMPVEFTLVPRPDMQPEGFRDKPADQLAFLAARVREYVEHKSSRETLARALVVIGE